MTLLGMNITTAVQFSEKDGRIVCFCVCRLYEVCVRVGLR